MRTEPGLQLLYSQPYTCNQAVSLCALTHVIDHGGDVGRTGGGEVVCHDRGSSKRHCGHGNSWPLAVARGSAYSSRQRLGWHATRIIARLPALSVPVAREGGLEVRHAAQHRGGQRCHAPAQAVPDHLDGVPAMESTVERA
jgi:hypothetical protein